MPGFVLLYESQYILHHEAGLSTTFRNALITFLHTIFGNTEQYRDPHKVKNLIYRSV